MSATPFTGLVLAGGQSSRMGCDKRQLVLADQNLLSRSIALLQEAGATEVLVSGDSDTIGAIADVLPQAGPPGALYSVLSELQRRVKLVGRWLLIIPVDMPRLRITTLQQLLLHTGEATAVHFHNEVFPCLLRATPQFLGHLGQLFAQSQEKGGKRSMKALLAFLEAKVLPIPVDLQGEFANVNTPADWQSVLNWYSAHF